MAESNDRASQREAPPEDLISKNVAANLLRVRKERGFTTEKLANALASAGQPIPDTGITRIEKGRRRVSADELYALAVILNVPPAELSLPHDTDRVQLSRTREVSVRTAQAFVAGVQTPEDPPIPGEGVNLAEAGADGGISVEAFEKEQAWQRQQAAFSVFAYANPTGAASSHQAVRTARILVDALAIIVTPEPGVTPALQASRIRTARRRLTQLTLELDEIEEALAEYEARDVEVFREPGRIGERHKWTRRDGKGPEYPIETWTDAGTNSGEGPSEGDSPTPERD